MPSGSLSAKSTGLPPLSSPLNKPLKKKNSRNRNLLLVSSAVLLLGIAISCSKSGNNSSPDPGSGSGQDNTILLNLGNNIILPAYQTLSTAVNSLDSAIADFNTSPT